MTEGDLYQFALVLRNHCRETSVSDEYSRNGVIQGLNVDGVFYPQWELELLENQSDLWDLNFYAIKSRRSDNFECAEPRFWPKPPKLKGE